MEGVSKIFYKGKTIIYADYSAAQKSKEKIIAIMKAITEEYMKCSPKSVLGLTNVTGLSFDMEVLKAFKESSAKAGPYEKKIAVIGVSGLLKAGYDFVIGFTNSHYKLFNTELEAKEWLVQD